MTIVVAGRWELEWNTPIKEIELWNLMLRDYQVKDWYMFPVTGVQNKEDQITLHEKATMEEILSDEKLRNFARVFFEPYNPVQQPEAGIDLRFFDHPKDVVYVFGSAHYNPVPNNKREKDFIVQVPTKENKGVLWPHQCAAVCLYDRLSKEMKGNKINFPDSF